MHGRLSNRCTANLSRPTGRRVFGHAIRRQLRHRRLGAEPLDHVRAKPGASFRVLNGFQRAVARVSAAREKTRDEGTELEWSRQVLARLPQSHELAYIA